MNKILKGVDLSHWNKITNYDLPVDFVILKATQGNRYVDPTYHERVKEFRKRRKVVIGHYHFASGLKHKYLKHKYGEAEHFLKTVDYKKGDFVALDYETRVLDPVNWCLDWLKKVEKELGIKPLIYLNVSTTEKYNWKPVTDNGNGLWIADYSIREARIGQWRCYAIRQTTSKGKIKGIVGNVDLNVANNLTSNKMDKIKETKKVIKEYIYNFKKFINEKEDVKIARKIKEIIEDGNKLIEQNKKLKKENAELSLSLKNNSYDTDKFKEAVLSLSKAKASLNGYVVKVKNQKKTIKEQAKRIKELQGLNQGNAKDAKIVDSLVFFIKSIINKIK